MPDILKFNHAGDVYEVMDCYLEEVMHRNVATHSWGDLLVWFGTPYLRDYPAMKDRGFSDPCVMPTLFTFDPNIGRVGCTDDWYECGDFIIVDAIACIDELQYNPITGRIEGPMYELLGRNDLEDV